MLVTLCQIALGQCVLKLEPAMEGTGRNYIVIFVSLIKAAILSFHSLFSVQKQIILMHGTALMQSFNVSTAPFDNSTCSDSESSVRDAKKVTRLFFTRTNCQDHLFLLLISTSVMSRIKEALDIEPIL